MFCESDLEVFSMLTVAVNMIC